MKESELTREALLIKIMKLERKLRDSKRKQKDLRDELRRLKAYVISLFCDMRGQV